jgi:hypothetical protein
MPHALHRPLDRANRPTTRCTTLTSFLATFSSIFSLFSTSFTRFYLCYDTENMNNSTFHLYALDRSNFHAIPSDIDRVIVCSIFCQTWTCSLHLELVCGQELVEREGGKSVWCVSVCLLPVFHLLCTPAVRYQHPAWSTAIQCFLLLFHVPTIHNMLCVIVTCYLSLRSALLTIIYHLPTVPILDVHSISLSMLG